MEYYTHQRLDKYNHIPVVKGEKGKAKCWSIDPNDASARELEALSPNGNYLADDIWMLIDEEYEAKLLQAHDEGCEFTIKTGEQRNSGIHLIVIDIDNTKKPKQMLDKFIENCGETFVRKTPKGGYHIYYESPVEITVGNRIDLREYFDNTLEIEILDGWKSAEGGNKRETIYDVPVLYKSDIHEFSNEILHSIRECMNLLNIKKTDIIKNLKLPVLEVDIPEIREMENHDAYELMDHNVEMLQLAQILLPTWETLHGKREKPIIALTNILKTYGYTLESCLSLERILRPAGNDDRSRTVKNMYESNAEKKTGFPKLAAYIGVDLTRQVRTWITGNSDGYSKNNLKILKGYNPRSGEKYIELVDGQPRITYGEEGWDTLINIKIEYVKLYKPLYPEYDGQEAHYDIRFKYAGGRQTYKKIKLNDLMDKLTKVHGLRIHSTYSSQDVAELIQKMAIMNDGNSISTGAPGIFYKDGKIYLEEIDKPDDNKPWNILRELEQDIEPSLQPIFRDLILWNLGAPFNFARKMMGGAPDYYPSIIAYGLGKTSKTTLEKLGQSIWFDLNTIDRQMKSGSFGFGSNAQRRLNMSQHTHPIMVEEFPDNIGPAVDYMKDASNMITQNIVRKDGRGTIEFFMMSLVYLSTNNTPDISDTGNLRRLIILPFDDYTKPISKETAEQFSKKWLQHGNNKVNMLQNIGKMASQYISKHPETLQKPWEEIGPTILKEIGGPQWTYSNAFQSDKTMNEMTDNRYNEVIDLVYKIITKHYYDNYDTYSIYEEDWHDFLHKKLIPKASWMDIADNGEDIIIGIRELKKFIKRNDPETQITESDIKQALNLVQGKRTVRGKKRKVYTLSEEELTDLLNI